MILLLYKIFYCTEIDKSALNSERTKVINSTNRKLTSIWSDLHEEFLDKIARLPFMTDEQKHVFPSSQIQHDEIAHLSVMTGEEMYGLHSRQIQQYKNKLREPLNVTFFNFKTELSAANYDNINKFLLNGTRFPEKIVDNFNKFMPQTIEHYYRVLFNDDEFVKGFCGKINDIVEKFSIDLENCIIEKKGICDD